MKVLSVNTSDPLEVDYTSAPGGITGIAKQPTVGPVAVTAPGPKGTGGSGLSGDTIGDLRHHGGDEQAVYAYAREDLDEWAAVLGRDLSDGAFGENLTTHHIDVTGALVGERWQVGSGPLLEVTSPRIPCRTFAGWLGERGWIKRFTQHAAPGAYLRVLSPGAMRSGDPVELVHRPAHQVSVRMLFQALTTRPELLPGVLAAGEALHPEAQRAALRRTA